ncbi:MAG: T9SS type A sorting domain-containing protein, partial [Flavobacteriales bacterium]
TNLDSANCSEVTTGAVYGSSFANLINSGSGHKRFTTQPVTLVGGKTYKVEYWVAGLQGDMRLAFYDGTNGNYLYPNGYNTLSSAALVKLTDSITVPATCTSGEFIFSFRSTSALGVGMDSVSIMELGGTTPPPPPGSYSVRSIYEIQYTTASNGDSPFEDSLVELTGVVTGVSTDTRTKGYFIQDSASAWNGIFINDGVGTPVRGDKVTVRGEVKENFDNTQLMSVDTMIIVSSGNSEPTPINANSTAAADEKYEGVLLKVSATMCVDTVVRFGEWFIAGSAADTLMVDDLLLSTTYNPVLYQGYDVTGVLFYSFRNFKIEPRDSTDIVQNIAVSLIENNETLTINLYPNPVQNVFTLSGVDLKRAEIFTTTGKLVRTLSLNSINTVDVNDLRSGAYIIKVYDNSNKFAISRFIKQ